jgi:uncharacterized C2H2 Zn-finger protein
MMLNPVPHKCPECGRVFESGRGLGPHRRGAHRFKLPKKQAKKRLAETVKEYSGEIEWDAVGERWATACPECQLPRRIIHMPEGTYLRCDNWDCQLFARPLESERRSIAFITPAPAEKPIEEAIE